MFDCDFLKRIEEKLGISINFIVMLEVFIAFVIFIFIVFKLITLFDVIVYLLSLMIIIEVVRMLIDFVFDKNHVIKIRLVIDSFILFFLRDVVLVISEEKYTHLQVVEKLTVLIPIITIFFFFRYLSIKNSSNIV